MNHTVSELRAVAAEVGRVLEGIDAQITEARHVLHLLTVEGQQSGSLAAGRRAEEIDEEEDAVRSWLRSLRAHRAALDRREAAIKAELARLYAATSAAKSAAEAEKNARKARVSG